MRSVVFVFVVLAGGSSANAAVYFSFGLTPATVHARAARIAANHEYRMEALGIQHAERMGVYRARPGSTMSYGAYRSSVYRSYVPSRSYYYRQFYGW